MQFCLEDINWVQHLIISDKGRQYCVATSTIEVATAQARIQFRDEGVDLWTNGTVEKIDFVGAGVTATRVGNVVTVTIP